MKNMNANNVKASLLKSQDGKVAVRVWPPRWRAVLVGILLIVGCDSKRLCQQGGCDDDRQDAGTSKETNAEPSSKEASTSGSARPGSEQLSTSEEASSREVTGDKGVTSIEGTHGCDSGDACYGGTVLCSRSDQGPPDCVPCELESNRGCVPHRPYCIAIGKQSDESAAAGEVVCGECRDEGDCGDSDTPLCVDHRCVACTQDDHCTSSNASRCDLETNQCARCNDIGQCAHLAATPACDLVRGRCVECTREESDACDGRVCNVLAGEPGHLTCSEHVPSATEQCGECVNDEQCATGLRCIAEQSPHFAGERTGKYHCMALESELKSGDSCADNVPFIRSLTAASEGGEEGTYCTLRTATCTTYLALGSKPYTIPADQPGAGEPTCPVLEPCGFFEAGDGICRESCTYICESADDCPAGMGCIGACVY